MISAAEISTALQDRGFHVDHIAGRIVGSIPLPGDIEDLVVLVHPASGGFGWATYWRWSGRRLVLNVLLASDVAAVVGTHVPAWLWQPLQRRDGGT